MVKTILKKYKYPPDRQEEATETVLKQAETLSMAWSGAAISAPFENLIL